MTKEEIKALDISALQTKIAEKKEELADMKLSNSISPIENPIQIRTARRVVARLLTELGNKSNAV